MCQTNLISDSIVSLSKRSFSRRLRTVLSHVAAEKRVLTRLNNQLDELYELLYCSLPDHKNHRSRKDGYRLIYLTYRNQDKVVFLDIYPKNGPSQQLDTSDDRLLDLIQEYIQESDTSKLFEHNLSEGLLP